MAAMVKVTVTIEDDPDALDGETVNSLSFSVASLVGQDAQDAIITMASRYAVLVARSALRIREERVRARGKEQHDA